MVGRTRKGEPKSRTRSKTAAAALGEPPVPSPFDPRQSAVPKRGRPSMEHIPWSYGQDRVTAMAIDPNRLHVYWEVSDPAIEKAREGLGQAGQDAWLNLRVYDVSGRLFDGTNAHSYFDIRVERNDRQWMIEVGKPTSTAIVEVGLKSLEGHFVKMARSGRVDFPRDRRMPDSPSQWLTVRAEGGYGSPRVLVQERQEPPPAQAAHFRRAEGRGSFEVFDGPFESVRDRLAELAGRFTWFGWQFPEVLGREWSESFRTFWESGQLEEGLGWESGPFATPFGPISVSVEYQRDGTMRIEYFEGKARVVHGPWQVVVRGLGATGGRAVFARWQVQRSWIAASGVERLSMVEGPGVRGGSGWLKAGASERSWQRASETRLAGASELLFWGASERRYGGASEVIFMGASEVRLRGASEIRLRGASERRFLGASERRFAGASERRFIGASETLR